MNKRRKKKESVKQLEVYIGHNWKESKAYDRGHGMNWNAIWRENRVRAFTWNGNEDGRTGTAREQRKKVEAGRNGDECRAWNR